MKHPWRIAKAAFETPAKVTDKEVLAKARL
jgi:hypothetical protein